MIDSTVVTIGYKKYQNICCEFTLRKTRLLQFFLGCSVVTRIIVIRIILITVNPVDPFHLTESVIVIVTSRLPLCISRIAITRKRVYLNAYYSQRIFLSS